MKPMPLRLVNDRRCLPIWLTLLGWTLSLTVEGASLVYLPHRSGTFVIDPATLAVSLHPGGEHPHQALLSAPAFHEDAQVIERTGNCWRVRHADRDFRVEARLDREALVVTVHSRQPGRLDWPSPMEDGAIEAHAIPFGEGAYIPSDDPQWLDWLLRRYPPARLNGVLSMPFWTELRKDYSLTWIVETPFNTRFGIKEQNGRPLPTLSHAFNRLAPDAPYRVRIVVGPREPLVGARLYRQWLRDHHRFVSLREKIAAQPQVARLGGAPHIYLWDAGPLKAGDVLHWPQFLRFFARHREDSDHLASRLWGGFELKAREAFLLALAEADRTLEPVPPFARTQVIRAINTGLQYAIAREALAPLPGNHDPQAEVVWAQTVRRQLREAFGDLLAPAEHWGGGLSLDTVAALQGAGLARAWLGADDWRDTFWHPEAVEAAKAAGYLVSVYDSYGSAHPSNLQASWATAKMGDELVAAGYTDEQGKKIQGFNGRGVYVNPRSVEAYARRRISAVAQAGRLNSYFLDVDAAGPEFSDYTPGRETSQAQDAEARRRRLAYPIQALGLVTGSEGGLSFYAPIIAFSHGIATQPFAWMDPDMRKNKRSRYYLGGYWPPETPNLYFKAVPLKPEVARFVTSAEFRLPLYQMVLHDSLVSTHHWEYGSLKFSSERNVTALLQLLYMVPPLYHLNDQVIPHDLPLISAYDKVFRPLHERLFTQAMDDFQVLSGDRLLQRSTFADGTLITVNFSVRPRRTPEGRQLPPLSAHVIVAGEPAQLIEIRQVLGAS
ncbi:glycoside hydrolase [Pseudomonas batumici]|uniref:Putative Lipoprotein n=1 Tax=Pseudomonas batumici TaxID=226910 RepID=A0A0C2EC41_9PSED|nr:glycoside hydrolase [Pseudomonas batumici]KIH83459.1 putative Lipoprotein [Pseudomonas batumici]